MTQTRQEEHTRAQRALFERLGWQVAERDDQAVASVIANHEELDGIHSLDQAGLLDPFMDFLREIGFLDYLKTVAPSRRKRFMVPAFLILLTYMIKTLFSIDSVYSMPDLLFSDTGVMKLLGFNAKWLNEGLCDRSWEKRGEDKEQPKPFCPQMVANFMGDFKITEMLDFFNEAIRCLARAQIFPSEISTILDATDIETTEKCDGATWAKRKRKVKHGSKTKTVEVLVHGFKAHAILDQVTQIPISLMVTKINCHESRCTKRMLRQARDNVAPGGSSIKDLLIDRGYLDGKTLWTLDQEGVRFVIPAKKTMLVHRAAIASANHNEGIQQSRIDRVTQGHGSKSTVEELETKAIGIQDLCMWDAYNDPEEAKHSRRRGYRPKALNAVVVQKWKDEICDPEDDEKPVVLLTNSSVQKPLVVVDDYDNRSLIENTLFREGKQAWSLENIPKKSANAVVAHLCMTFAMFALSMGFRWWQTRLQEEAEDEGEETPTYIDPSFIEDHDGTMGTRRWRRQMKRKSRDYVIVFAGPHYGIFHLMEFAVLSGFRVKELDQELGTTSEEVLRRYGVIRGP